MGTLYVVGLPTSDPDDLTLRARRVLESAAQWASVDPARFAARLKAWGLSAPAAGLAPALDALPALQTGDVALLVDGARLGLDDEARRLVTAALARGFPVVPVPGPTLPLTALVISGLPADGFCYLGELAGPPAARRGQIEAVAAERRTLICLVTGAELVPILDDLSAILGSRPLSVVANVGDSQQPAWRGTLDSARQEPASLPAGQARVLVVGGARQEQAAWDQSRLAAEVERRLARGQGAKEISQALAELSGWSRREIYRLATRGTSSRPERRP